MASNPCGTPSNTIIISGAGSPAVNQTYTLQGNGTWLSADGLYQIEHKPSAWVIEPTAPPNASALYYSFPAEFPCVWHSNGIGVLPVPSGHYGPQTPAQFAYEPATDTIGWEEGANVYQGDLAFFNANANKALVTTINLTQEADVISISNLSDLPALQVIQIPHNLITVLNLTGCYNLTSVLCSFNLISSIVGLGDCTLLTYLDCHSNSLTSLDCTGLVHLTGMNCSANSITPTITGLTTCIALVTLLCNSNSLTSLDCTGLVNLATLDCSTNKIGSGGPLTLAGCASLITLICTANPFLSGVVLTGFTSLQTFSGSDCAFTSLDFSGQTSLTTFTAVNSTGPLSSLDFTNCSSIDTLDLSASSGYGSLTSVITSGCLALAFFSVQANKVTSLTLTTLPLLDAIDCSHQVGGVLNSLNLSNLPALLNLSCIGNSITTVNVSGSPLTFLYLQNNQLTTLAVNTILFDADAAGGFAGDGDLSGQTPAAPPSVGPPNGIAALNNLVVIKGWVLPTD